MNKIAAIKESLERFKKQATAEAEKVTNDSVAVLLQLNLKQLREGKNNIGEEITPSYLNDDYFKTRESAMKYAIWKQRITPNPKRNFKTPNLIITGEFHKSIKATPTGDGVRFHSDTELGRKVTAKFKNILSLNNESKNRFIKEVLTPRLIKFRDGTI